MSYLNFLLIFLVPPIVVGSIYFFRTENENRKDIGVGICVLAIVAFLYTTPWDNYLVKTNVWSYGLDRVLGVIGYVPIEEYCFFILQTFMTGGWFYYVQKVLGVKKSAKPGKKIKFGVLIIYTSVLILGVIGLTNESSKYFGLIVTWSMPIVLLQWAIGGKYILNNLRLFCAGLLVPTVYLCIADAIAISNGIWEISNSQTLGYAVGALPFEEAVFFLLTNLMLIQGLILFVAMKDTLLKRFT